MLRQHCAIGKRAEQYLLMLGKQRDNVNKKFFFFVTTCALVVHVSEHRQRYLFIHGSIIPYILCHAGLYAALP